MSSASKTVRDLLGQALLSAAKFNRAVQAAPVAVLWTDRERFWQDAVPALQVSLPGLLSLGPYDPERRTGPAIWLKCAISGLLPEVDLRGQVPIIYLPGVSRADLRAIESCPRDLQPLAELQYRGAFWSQESAKDWTINAFLVSTNGGLGLDVAQDKATQEALVRALRAGVLLDRPLSDMQSRQVNAEWLDSLLAPNPTRDILVWLNDPKQTQEQWGGGRWELFVSRCKKDYGFDPTADGVITAAEKLAARKDGWAAVWELYADSYTSFPHVLERLDNVTPPASFVEDLSTYPKANADREDSLRADMKSLAAQSQAQARKAVLEFEKSHGERRKWLWARLGRAPLAQALEHLAQVAELTEELPGGTTLDQIADKYRNSAWRVDAGAVQALAAVHSKSDIEAVSSALRALYVPWLEGAAVRFQEVVSAAGGLNPQRPAQNAAPDGVCTIFVDGLRFDAGMELAHQLQSIGQVTMGSAWTSIPSVTASGKAWASPVAGLIGGKPDDAEFEPSVAATGQPLTAHNFRKLLEENGFQVLSNDQTGDPTGKSWAETGDLDHYGHEHGLRLARDLKVQLEQVVERIAELRDAGWKRFRIVTDHGWLLVPGRLPKSELPMHQAQERWGRCALLKDGVEDVPLTFGWDWCNTVQVAVAPGISSFRAGAEYAHGGLSLQECLVPILDVETTQGAEETGLVQITGVTWKRSRCNVEVTSGVPGLRVDIRTKAALATSSVVQTVRSLEGGKASLVVPDEELVGTVAVIVVLDENGAVLQKTVTTIGE